MNTYPKISFVAAALAVTLTFAIVGSAQRAGGFKEISKMDAAARAAAVFAVAADGENEELDLELVAVHQAERQVVAGTRFRLCLEVAAEDIEPWTVRAIVFRDLKGSYRLMSWTEEECGGDDDG